MNYKFRMSDRGGGFTLAETLITLGIIGVVAVLVLPVMINNIRDKQFEALANKAKRTIVNGYKLMMSRQEIADVKLIDFLGRCNELSDTGCVSLAHKGSFNLLQDSADSLSTDRLPAEYSIMNSGDKSPFKWSDAKYIFITPDGIIYGLLPSDSNLSIDVVADLNSANKPNTVFRDLRKYRFSGHGEIFDVTEELAQSSACKWDNLTACTTQEMCMSVTPPKDSVEMVWVDDNYKGDIAKETVFAKGKNRCSYISPG